MADEATPSRDSTTTWPRSFRLDQRTLDDLDYLIEHYSAETGVPHTRTDALRRAARVEADRARRKKTEK